MSNEYPYASMRDSFDLSASLLYNRAGEVADTTSHGPGSFQVAFLDALWNVTAEQVAESEILVQ